MTSDNVKMMMVLLKMNHKAKAGIITIKTKSKRGQSVCESESEF